MHTTINIPTISMPSLQMKVTWMSLKVVVFYPDLWHCLFIQAKFELFDFEVIIQDSLGKI